MSTSAPSSSSTAVPAPTPTPAPAPAPVPAPIGNTIPSTIPVSSASVSSSVSPVPTISSSSNSTKEPESSAQTSSKKTIWINSWYDPLASVCTPSQNMCFSNINNDGDYKLVTGTSLNYALSRGCATTMDLETKSKSKLNHLLKVFSGPNLLTQNVLISDISGVASFFIDYNTPRRPVIAVACGEFLFLYKNIQPFYRFILPQVDIPQREVEVWTDLMNGNLAPEKGYKEILELRNSGAKISVRSKEMLSLTGRENILKFIEDRRKSPLSMRSFITCMETIRKDQPEGECIHSLILGTEDGMVHILNQTCTKILSSFQLPSPPAIIKAIGVLDVDHRIIIGCRDAKIYQIRNGALSAISLAIETPIVALEFIDKKSIAVVSMKNCIHVFHPKGQKQYTLYFDCPVKAVCVLQLTGFSLGTNILCVALENKELRIYKGKQLIETANTVEEVVGLQFGTYGTEANTLVLSYRNGALEFKNISRRANFDTAATGSASNGTTKANNGTPKEQDEPLEGMPVKTKLALEFMKREKEEATEMHREFQRELCKLKVTTARSYVKILTDGEGQISFAQSNNLRVHANVQGLGPLFKIKFLIQNTSNKTLMKIPVVFGYNQNIYKIKRARMVIPCLIPGLKYQFSIDVFNIDPTAADGIKLLVCRPNSPKPLITCLINMPMSEPM